MELEKLPIPSHWPGEPEWLKGREEKAENAIVVNDSGAASVLLRTC